VHKDVIETPSSFGGTQRLGKLLARAGERWTFGLHPADLPGYLATRGLELIDDLGAADYRTRYLGGPGEGYEFYRVATARVVGATVEPTSRKGCDSRERHPEGKV